MISRRRLSLPLALGLMGATALMAQGCAAPLGLAIAEIGAGTAASAGISHTLGGISYKTFTAPSEDVHIAARRALDTMGIACQSDTLDDGTRQLNATASDRDIDIEIEALTPKTTRLRVVASEYVVLKDSATAAEIIMQTAHALEDLAAQRTARASRSRVAKSRP
jgi:hypothetical protein